MLRGFITNLGKYNEGELVGEWIEFPIEDDELEKVKERIGIDKNHEEWFFTDYECDLDGFDSSALGEYESIDDLNKLGDTILDIENDGLEDQFSAGIAIGLDFDEASRKARDGEIIKISDMNTFSDADEVIGYYYVDLLGGLDQLDKETKEMYFDYDALGRDISIDYYQVDDEDPETAGEYWCGDENASNEEIGEAVINDLGFDGISNPEYYFDYESYGRDIKLEGSFVETNKGLFEIID